MRRTDGFDVKGDELHQPSAMGSTLLIITPDGYTPLRVRMQKAWDSEEDQAPNRKSSSSDSAGNDRVELPEHRRRDQALKDSWGPYIADWPSLPVLRTSFLDLVPGSNAGAAFPRPDTFLGDGGENLADSACERSAATRAQRDSCGLAPRTDAQWMWLTSRFPSVTPVAESISNLCEDWKRENVYRHIAHRMAPSVFSPCWPCCSAIIPRPACISSRKSTPAFTPARQSLLLELIERQTARGKCQVITTTHAPTLLTVVNDTTFENMSVVSRLEGSSNAIIRPVAGTAQRARKLRQVQRAGTPP